MSRHLTNIAIVSFFTLSSRVLGLLRDIVLFAYLGATAINSAFLFAFTLPNLFRRLLGEGALSSALVPVFTQEYEKDGHQAAFRFLNQALTWVLIILIALVILGSLSLWGLGHFKGFEERWYLGFELGIVLLPYMLFVCLAAIMAAALNVFERFALGALSQVWLNLSMIFFLSVLGAFFGKTAMGQVYFLCIGVLVGGLIQVVVPGKTLIKLGWRPKLDFNLSESILEIAKLMLPGLAGAVIFQINIVVSQLFAFALNNHSVSIMYLANRLIEFPLGVFTIAVTTVLFPTIARLAAQKNTNELGIVYQKGLRMIFAITIPAMVGLIVLNGPILRFLFEWGNFDIQDIKLTIPILIAFSVALPFYSLSTFATRGFHSMKDMKTPYKIAIFIFLLNVILSLSLMYPLGTLGLASANVISAIVNAITLQRMLEKRNTFFRHDTLFHSSLKIVLAASAMGVFASTFSFAFFKYFGISKIGDLILISLGIPSSIGVYFYMLKMLKFEEIKEFAKLLKFKKLV
ncbi:MAG: murein biosynthesis integral membrane protein MurJ [Verrucomicrobia bacterium]|nr:MAG: murein biosynthesis integral membrane protein MurJ [Verrucomicrobiota bacterium]